MKRIIPLAVIFLFLFPAVSLKAADADSKDSFDKQIEEDIKALKKEVVQPAPAVATTSRKVAAQEKPTAVSAEVQKTSPSLSVEAPSVKEMAASQEASQPSASIAEPESASDVAEPAAEVSAASSPSAPVEAPAPAPEKKRATISDIEVRGNNIVSTNTILAKLQSQKGNELIQETVNEDIKRLYTMGYFEDIKIEVNEKGNGQFGLVVVVIEKPVIKKIVIEGSKSFKEDKILKELKVVEGQVLDRKAVKQGVEGIRKLYANKGFKNVDIASDVNIDRNTNETTVIVRINEGGKFKIRSLDFDGVKSFKEKQLRKMMKTKPKGWLFRSGVLKSENFDEDVERIRLFYQKEGFLDVKVAPEFQYDDKEQAIHIKVMVEEGSRYMTGVVKISGNKVFPESEIWQELEMLPGQTFSQYYLSQDIEKIRDYYQTRGYMDARIIPDTKMNATTQKMDVTYSIEEGDLYFVEKVMVRGNTKTKDLVIRRELRIRPGDKFDGGKIKKSKQRLENLGFFEEITYDTEPTASAQNRKDLVFRVKEKRTGELSFGGGVSSVDNLVGFAEIAQRNFDLLNWPRFTGGGQNLSLRARVGQENTSFNLNFAEPYLFNKPIGYGLDLYRTHEDPFKVDFAETRLGATNTISKLFRDVLRVGTGYTLENVNIDEISDDATDTIRQVGGDNLLSRWKAFTSIDTRDNVFNPTRGFQGNLSGEIIGGFLGGDQDYYILQTSAAKYWPLFKNHVVETRIKLGTSSDFGDTSSVPVFDRFYAGGLGTVRGYNYRRVGPKESGNPVGGQTMEVINLDYTIPVPRLDSFRLAAFCDLGNITPDSYDFFKLSDTVISVGPGVKIKTPLGPIALYYGFPLTNKDDENTNGRFEFSLSRGF